MKKIILGISFLFFATTIGCAQEAEPFVKKSFVIVQSTKNYVAAKLHRNFAG